MAKQRFNKEKNNKHEKINFYTVFFYLSLFLVIVLVCSNFKLYNKRKELQRQIVLLKKQNENLQINNTDLKNAIVNIKKEDYKEEILRRIGYAKQGEEEIIIKLPEIVEQQINEKNVWQSLIVFCTKYADIFKSIFKR